MLMCSVPWGYRSPGNPGLWGKRWLGLYNPRSIMERRDLKLYHQGIGGEKHGVSTFAIPILPPVNMEKSVTHRMTSQVPNKTVPEVLGDYSFLTLLLARSYSGC